VDTSSGRPGPATLAAHKGDIVDTSLLALAPYVSLLSA
jgi:hypothetical protein